MKRVRRSGPAQRTRSGSRSRSRWPWLLAAAVLFGTATCAIEDPAARPGGGSGGNGGAGSFADSGGTLDAGADAPDFPVDRGTPPTEPPLTVMDCSVNVAPNVLCCASALGFEDGSSQHFLTPACCRMALSTPQIVPTPTACGRAALRLDADFRALDPGAECGFPGEAVACAFQTGEVSRGVLSSLTLTGFTLSAMAYLDGPGLPGTAPQGSVFVIGHGGLVEGTPVPITQIGTWTRLELPIATDSTDQGVDIRVIGVHVTFHGQPWVGHVYLDEITWR